MSYIDLEGYWQYGEEELIKMIKDMGNVAPRGSVMSVDILKTNRERKKIQI